MKKFMRKAVCVLLFVVLTGFYGFAVQAGHIQDVTPNFTRKIAEKYQINSDTVGWLYIPGTNINDVVVQNPPNNNSFYLTHNFLGVPDKNGVFCADRRCSFLRGGQLSRITTIYGHTWDENPNGDFFHQLKRYTDPDFAKNNPYIFFATGEKNMAWEVFAVFYTTTDLPYIIPDLSWDRFKSLIQVVFSSSIYNYGIKISEKDKILTLSTCTYNVPGVGALPTDTENHYRFVIMAKLSDPDTVQKETAYFSLNRDVMPVHSQPKIERDDPEYLLGTQ